MNWQKTGRDGKGNAHGYREADGVSVRQFNKKNAHQSIKKTTPNSNRFHFSPKPRPDRQTVASNE